MIAHFGHELIAGVSQKPAPVVSRCLHASSCPAVNEFVKRVRAARIHCLVIGAPMVSLRLKA